MQLRKTMKERETNEQITLLNLNIYFQRFFPGGEEFSTESS